MGSSYLQIARILALFSALITCQSHAQTDLADLQANGEVRIGVDIPYGVMEFYDDNGREAGIDIDMLRTIAEEFDISATFVAMPFDKLFEAIQSRQVDLVASAVTITPERQKTLLFSEPYLDAGMSLAVAAGDSDIQSHADLNGKRVAVLKGTVGEELAGKSGLFANATIVPYQINEVRMQALLSGEVDATIVHFLTTEDQRIRLVGDPLTQSFYGVVTHQDNRRLMDQINRVLRDMKRDGRLQAIKDRYL